MKKFQSGQGGRRVLFMLLIWILSDCLDLDKRDEEVVVCLLGSNPSIAVVLKLLVVVW
ncbi:unnamed protein product [Trifolium pratense]|uniref:Uncharacterized protein n=1 Tax=Trifolium pratense TaxID=57577 RepID=A0ACB0JDS6_TRIPR|nr:unnamed protein product [Trifolium pratense]